MTTNEIKDRIKLLKEQRMAVIDAAEKEKRDLTSAEIADNDAALKEIRGLEKDLVIAELRKVDIENKKPEVNPKEEVRKFSLVAAVRDAALTKNEPSEEVRAVNSLGAKELREAGIVPDDKAIIIPVQETRATITAAAGASVIATEISPLMDPIRDALILVKAGANFLTGMHGNLSIPDYSGTSAAWVAPGAAATDGAGTFSSKSLTPKRLAAIVTVDRQFLLQNSVSAEAMLRRDIINAIAGKLQSTILGAHAKGTANTPDGLLSGITLTAAVPTKANMTALKTAVNKANINTLRPVYVTNSEGYGLLETTKTDAGSGKFLLENGKMNGYDVLETNSIAAQGASSNEYPVFFGEFSHLIIAQWGAIELRVDPYTKSAEDQIRIIVNSYWDFTLRNADAVKSAAIKA